MIIGIDLGTTNSLVAICRDGKSELIPNALGKYLTPSVISIDDSNHVLVGQAAKDRLLAYPQRSIGNFKRLMGSSKVVSLGKQHFRPEELSALILKQLKQDAEHYLGQTVTEAIISVPAYFSDAQRKATKMAGELAGLKVERLINEPTAAALAYGLEDFDREAETNFLIFDLGGGTFDVSILELFDGIMEVRATTGDNLLGGEDILDLILDKVTKNISEINLSTLSQTDRQLYQRLRQEAERVKIKLGEQEEVVFSFNYQQQNYQYPISQIEFEQMLIPFFQRIKTPLERAVRDSALDIDKLDKIILVGGATRMPLIRRLVGRLFNTFPLMTLNPDEVVARGAAVQGALKSRQAALEDVVVTDVCPYTLGIEIVKEFGHRIEAGFFSPIIQRNSHVPISRQASYYTVHDKQNQVVLDIYQGENRLVKDNVKLGQVVIDTPPRPRGEVEVQVRFTYDINGLLCVDAHVPLTGEKRSLLIENHESGLTEREKQKALQRLATLKVHPREQQENQAFLAYLEHCFTLSLGEERDMIGEWATQFEALLEKQDDAQIQQFRREITEQLSYLMRR